MTPEQAIAAVKGRTVVAVRNATAFERTILRNISETTRPSVIVLDDGAIIAASITDGKPSLSYYAPRDDDDRADGDGGAKP